MAYADQTVRIGIELILRAKINDRPSEDWPVGTITAAAGSLSSLNTGLVKGLREVADAIEAGDYYRERHVASMTENPVIVIAPDAPASTAQVLAAIARERGAQDAKWGVQDHPDGTGPDVKWMVDVSEHTPRMWFQAAGNAREIADMCRKLCQEAAAQGTVTWAHIALEEFAEALAEQDPAKLETELIQLAAVATAWAEAIRRRDDGDPGLRIFWPGDEESTRNHQPDHHVRAEVNKQAQAMLADAHPDRRLSGTTQILRIGGDGPERGLPAAYGYLFTFRTVARG